MGPKKFLKSSIEGTDFRQVMEEMCNTCSEDELRFFTSMARKLWFRRNEYIHGGSFTHPTTLVQQVCRAMADYMTANETSKTDPRQSIAAFESTWAGVGEVELGRRTM